jgi:hypothetical protein
MSLLDSITGGASGTATSDEEKALEALQGVTAPTAQALDLPALAQEVNAGNMTPAQMTAYLQQNNALANENVNQQGTTAQQAALSQLAQVANAGAAGTPTEQAQIAQALQQSNTNLAGQRGAIDQAAQARGVAPGLLQAALAQQNAGQDAQNANQAALQAQSQAYQTALNAMTGQANVGQALQGQQNTQANTVAQAQNAMQQFNAANQQNAVAANAGYQQAANSYNTQNAQNIANTNTGLANQQTEYNAQVPETVFNNQMQQATGIANQRNQMANTATQQGQQNAGLMSGLLGTAGTIVGGMYGGPAGATAGNYIGSQLGGGANGPPASANVMQYAPNQAAQGYGNPTNYAKGGVVNPLPAHYDCGHDMMDHMASGGMCMKHGGPVPGQAQVPGDSTQNDTVHARLSPGEFVVPRSIVQNHPEDIAALLQAMRQMRGGKQ